MRARGRRACGRLAVSPHDADPPDDVEHAGIVFEVGERDALDVAGTLPVGDEAGDVHTPPGLDALKVYDRLHARSARAIRARRPP